VLAEIAAAMRDAGVSIESLMQRGAVLVLEMVRVTEAAAIAASTLVGRGDEKAPMPPRSRRCARRSTSSTWTAPW
jgi:hypothetical protein